MPRFLTPSKIGLLVLVQLYTEELVHRDAILEVLTFISSSILDVDTSQSRQRGVDRWRRAEKSISLILSIKDFEALLRPYPAIAGIPGRRLWDVFLARFWGIDSLDALHNFFDNIHELLAKTKEELRRLAEQGQPPPPDDRVRLARNSPFGAFIRRSQLEFQRLRFHDACELWKDFARYRQETAPYWKRRKPGFQRMSFDSVLAAGQHEWGAESVNTIASVAYGDMLGDDHHRMIAVSTDDVEKLLEFQVDQMQKFGVRLPTELRHLFGDILRDSHQIPSLSHYSSFLDAWKAGDYESSFDYLHRYFDYTMQNRDRLFYQYALMNLAVLQADFGCHKEAVDAMLETVTTARENRDMMCLNFALNWLFHFGLAHPGLVQGGNLESSGSTFGSGKETMAFLRVKARETGMWTLWSSALLSEAHMALAQGDSVATALEHLVRSEHILVERNMCSLLGPQRAVAVAVWDRLGVSSLATLTCDVFLRCHASSPARRVGASGTAVGSAGVSPGSGSTNDGTVIFDDELRMVCRAADFLARKGRFDAATGLLESAVDSNALRSARAAADHACHRAIVQLRRDLHRGDLDGAEHLLVQLRGSVGARRVDISTRGGPEDDDEVLSANGELGLAIELLHVDYLTRRGDLGAAMAAVEALLSSVTISTDVEARTSLLLHKANLYVLAGRPARGFSLSLRAASLALRSRALPELWLACRHIATVLCSLREFSAAAKLLAAVLPRVLETDDMFAAGAMYAVLADAYVGLAGDGVPAAAVASVGSEHKRPGSAAGVSAGEKERREWLNRAMETLGRADSCFAAVEDVSARCEVVAKMAVVMRVSGDGPAAAGYAAKYADLRRLAAAYANGGG